MSTKNIKLFVTFLTLLVFGWSLSVFADDTNSDEEAEKELLRVVVNTDENIQGFRSWNDEEEMYQYIKRNFTKVFKKMEWPVTLKFDRWSANIPDEGLQLRVWFKSLEEETLDDLVFRAWVNLCEDGEKVADFGIIKVRTYPRPARNTYDTLDENITLAGEAVAKKLDEHQFKKP